LPDDEMLGTGMALGADRRDDRAAPWVKRIDDPDLNRRTPGSMTLLRPIPLHNAHLAIIL
jgi:hypothetical protein